MKDGERMSGPVGRSGAALLTLGLALLSLSAAHAQYDGQADFPKRRPGLWEVRIASAAANGLGPTLNCVGDQTDAQEGHLDRFAGPKGSCTLGAFKRAGDVWVAESICREGKSQITSKAVATGDFIHDYRIDTAVTYDPPLGGARKEDKDAIVARHLGPCQAHQRPGDQIIPGMGTLNMVDGTFRAEPPAAKAPRRKRSSEPQPSSAL